MRGKAKNRRAPTAKSAPELVVLSREEAERYEPSLKEICISISDPDAERVMVHCNMGVSRSPGVALGLCDARGWATAALERSHPGWNRLVRALVSQSATNTNPRRST